MKQKSYNNKHFPEYDYLKPASTQDCTGLIPSGPVDEEEMEQYEELYSFLPPTFSTHSGTNADL